MEPLQADTMSLIVMLISLVVLVVSIIKFNVHPVFALIYVAIFSAIGFGYPLGDVITTVMNGFGSTIGSIGIVIILGCAMGVILEDTGAALVLANSILKLVGKKHSAIAMAISGYLVSIPVFSDSAIVILSPVAKALSARGGVPFFALLGSLNVGILATHTMVPPTPGPLAAAGTLGADLGLVIALGLISSFAYTIAAMLYCTSKPILKKYPHVYEMENVDVVLNDDFTIKSEKKLPNAGLTFAVILVPVVLICLNSFAKMGLPADAPILTITGFIGHPIISLTIGVLLALFLDTSRFSMNQFSDWCTKAVDTSGFIILATGAAGAYGAVLKTSGVGTYLGNLIAETPLPAVFVPFLVAVLLSVSNGSATVSLLTGSAIILPLMPALGLHPVIATLAIAAGSSFFYHANASHFWVVCKMNDLEMKEGLALVSVGSAIGSIAGGIAVWIMSMFLTI